ncbi:hypothetical protein NXV84_20745 [Bacteroides fragilis]|uniref:hypothetical protein n=1 Tax=Bacteroides fragilis TaxID=817 RepID=UPI0004B83D1C|nr:hypothetical protein [Bacteroides fragilis]MCS2329218.1 hypothetical protein [Bacteroides fragilis]
MSSRIDIQKRCKWCNAVFTAHKTTTEYCSHRCANLAYKDRVRKQRIESLQHELGKSIKTPPNLNKEYLTPSEVAELLNYEVCKYIKLENGNNADAYNLDMVIVLSYQIDTGHSAAFRKWLINKVTRKQECNILLYLNKETNHTLYC